MWKNLQVLYCSASKSCCSFWGGKANAGTIVLGYVQCHWCLSSSHLNQHLVWKFKPTSTNKITANLSRYFLKAANSSTSLHHLFESQCSSLLERFHVSASAPVLHRQGSAAKFQRACPDGQGSGVKGWMQRVQPKVNWWATATWHDGEATPSNLPLIGLNIHQKQQYPWGSMTRTVDSSKLASPTFSILPEVGTVNKLKSNKQRAKEPAHFSRRIQKNPSQDHQPSSGDFYQSKNSTPKHLKILKHSLWLIFIF